MYTPTRWDWATYLGTLGFFLFAMVLFIRVLPMITIFEIKALLPESEPHKVEVQA
jgi:molybdopterin-containing oxidoreductase family membrane subunit